MTSERQHRHASSTSASADDDLDAAPGRTSRSSLLQRKADANGVAPDADSAVAAAATSTGASLPAMIMRKFEGSLGADLSSVRVHTGGESAAAAAAVGAKAYTVGQDIHFGAGQFDPSSPAGQHLLAHEVAHTVQQRGGTPTRQHKLEVSSPHDAAEHEADRAADAMLAGRAAQVSTAGGALHRKPHVITIPTVTIDGTHHDFDGKHAIEPVFYARDNGDGPDSITEPWTSKPQVTPVLPKSGGAESFDSFGKANQQFRTVWDAVQAAWNKVVPIGKRYAHAQLDAQAKGLGDFGNQAGELDQSIEDMRFTTHTKVFDAFDGKQDVLGKGKTNYDTAKVSKTLKTEIADAKSEVATADTELHVQSLELANGKLDLSTASNNLANAARALDQLEIDRQIAPHLRAAEAAKKCSEICAAAIGAMGQLTTGDSVGKGANAASADGAKIVNTLYWDSELQKIQGQIDFLTGMKVANDLLTAKANIDSATNALKISKNKVAAALATYNQKTGNRAKSYRKLAQALEKAGVQSGLSAKDAEKVSLAVQAKPVMELALSTAEEMHGALPATLPAENDEAERGCALAMNRNELIDRYATLKTSKRVTKNSVDKWKARLAAVDKLVNAAHD